jgi:hypothetical protein
MGRDEVLEGSKEIRLRLVGREGSRIVISVENNAVVITVHHDRRNCAMSILSWYDPANVDISAHVDLHLTFAMVQYIIVSAAEMIGEISLIYDPSWMIINDCANMPSSIQEPSPL